ncbi:hypothetical protein LINPERHAP2_LOCUS17071 [Linum perenne]
MSHASIPQPQAQEEVQPQLRRHIIRGRARRPSANVVHQHPRVPRAEDRLRVRPQRGGGLVDFVDIYVRDVLWRHSFKGVDHELTLANIVARVLEFPKDHAVPAAAKDSDRDVAATGSIPGVSVEQMKLQIKLGVPHSLQQYLDIDRWEDSSVDVVDGDSGRVGAGFGVRGFVQKRVVILLQ